MCPYNGRYNHITATNHFVLCIFIHSWCVKEGLVVQLLAVPLKKPHTLGFQEYNELLFRVYLIVYST